jgi:hypothetical protein
MLRVEDLAEWYDEIPIVADSMTTPQLRVCAASLYGSVRDVQRRPLFHLILER